MKVFHITLVLLTLDLSQINTINIVYAINLSKNEFDKRHDEEFTLDTTTETLIIGKFIKKKKKGANKAQDELSNKINILNKMPSTEIITRVKTELTTRKTPKVSTEKTTKLTLETTKATTEKTEINTNITTNVTTEMFSKIIDNSYDDEIVLATVISTNNTEIFYSNSSVPHKLHYSLDWNLEFKNSFSKHVIEENTTKAPKLLIKGVKFKKDNKTIKIKPNSLPSKQTRLPMDKKSNKVRKKRLGSVKDPDSNEISTTNSSKAPSYEIIGNAIQKLRKKNMGYLSRVIDDGFNKFDRFADQHLGIPDPLGILA